MQTIERNYTKNPHTARFLRTFHDANGANNVTDLLDSVPVEAPAYRPSNAQESYIRNLTVAITALDAETGAQAAKYTANMNAHNAWTFEKTSNWIDRLKAKRDALRATAPQPAAPVQVADGRYAVEHEGTLKFFKVKNGRKAGFVFLDVQASDEWHSIRNLTYIRTVLALIAQDPHAAMVRYGHELGECGKCGRTLTDAESRAAGIGPVCAGK